MLQAFAEPAYLSRFLFYGLPRVAGHCARSGVRVVSKRRKVLLVESYAETTTRGGRETNLRT